jgi:CRISPR-associated protein Cas1
VVDRFVLRTCNLKQLKPEHFETSDGDLGVELTSQGLKIFFQAWEENLNKPLREKEVADRKTVREILGRQIERLALDFRGREPYRPFLYGG